MLGSDGATVLLELAAESDEEANDWIVNICQVVADSVRRRNTMQDSVDFFLFHLNVLFYVKLVCFIPDDHSDLF